MMSLRPALAAPRRNAARMAENRAAAQAFHCCEMAGRRVDATALASSAHPMVAFPIFTLMPCSRLSTMRRIPNVRRLHAVTGGGSASPRTGMHFRRSPPTGFVCRTACHPHPFLLHPYKSCLIGSAQHMSSNFPPGGPRRPPPNRITAGLGALATGGALLLGKGKYLLGALKLTKFASLGSMLFTVGTYTMFFGFPYACGMVGLILVHESGHALAMRRLGIPFSPMVFVPFMGAAVAMKRRPRDAYQEALVAFGGPALGSAGAAAVAVAAQATDSQLLFALADFGFMVNLFNMLPIGMMDGGRICGAVSPYAGVVGLGLGGSLIAAGDITNPIFYLIMLAGGYETFMRFYRPENVPVNYYRITSGQRMAITGGYFGLVGALFTAMAMNERYKKPPEVLQRERARRELYWTD